ncbi:MAG: TolC family protein, partial [Bacteriovoracia bacterium]
WQSPFKPANHLYEYRHSLSYSQDLWQNFFGRHFKSQIDEANFNSQGIEKKTKGLNQQVLFNFYQHWLNAKVAKTLVILQKDALNRSLRRSKTIWKRVKDGISEKADWYDSQIELEQYKEELNLQKQRLVEALSLLSQDLHREVKQIEINHFNLESLPTKSNFKTDIEGNYSLQALQNNILAAQENVEQSQMELLPSLKFYLQYTANNIDKEVNETYTNAVPTAPSNEKAIGLKLVWNFENDATKAKISQNKITKRALEYERKQLKNNLEKQISFLKDELELVRAKISNALNKRRFAGKSLNSINRLYLLGRTDIDRLLRSEERLIQADKSMVGHLTEYKILKARYASFIGNLKNYLLEEEL